MTHFMSAPGPYPWPGWLGWCPMQRSRTRLRVAMVGMVQIISGLDCDGNNNLITATTRPSTTSSSYTILPLCFSSTHTRQSANNAYHNNTQQQRWGGSSALGGGKLLLALRSLFDHECRGFSAFQFSGEIIPKMMDTSVQSTRTRQRTHP